MKRFPAAIACLSCVTLLAVTGCGAKDKKESAREAPQVVKGVTVAGVRSEPLSDFIEAVGTVRAGNSAVLAARIAGTVTALHAREGDRVAKGKLLLTLEAVEGSAGAAGARAAVDEAARGVAEAAARQRLAEATHERYRKLFAEQAVTRQEFEGRQMEREVAEQGHARAEARLVQAREGARAAGTIAGYTRIISPLSGIVTARGVDVGMTVFPGSTLVTVEEEGRYRLEVAAPETLSGKVKPGDSVRVTIEGAAGAATGKVAEVVPTVDPASRTFTVKVDCAASGLRSGMYGRVSFPAGTRPAILAPIGALVERGALSMVWVVGKDSIVRMRLVKTGRTSGERIEVVSGLSDGERIVTAGVEKVADGVRVE